VLDGGELKITSTANQDSPVLEGQTPLLGNDVWEHAYYLQYQNKRPDYLKAWWNVVNWPKVAERYSPRLWLALAPSALRPARYARVKRRPATGDSLVDRGRARGRGHRLGLGLAAAFSAGRAALGRVRGGVSFAASHAAASAAAASSRTTVLPAA
jgi:hypothetical protein